LGQLLFGGLWLRGDGHQHIFRNILPGKQKEMLKLHFQLKLKRVLGGEMGDSKEIAVIDTENAAAVGSWKMLTATMMMMMLLCKADDAAVIYGIAKYI